MTAHSAQTAIHYIQAWEPADDTALAALAPIAADIGKVAYQVDINRFFILLNNTGPVWMLLPNNTVDVKGNSTGAVTLDLADGDTFSIYDQTGNIVFTFSNPVQTGYKATITLIISMDGVGSHTRTWPASVDWPGGVEPTLSDGVDEVDVYTFVSVDGGTIWYGFLPGADMQ